MLTKQARNTRPDVGAMLGQRRGRWASGEPATSERLLAACRVLSLTLKWPPQPRFDLLADLIEMSG